MAPCEEERTMAYVTDRWFAILDSREVGHRRGLGVRRLGQDLALWRDASGHIQAALDLNFINNEGITTSITSAI